MPFDLPAECVAKQYVTSQARIPSDHLVYSGSYEMADLCLPSQSGSYALRMFLQDSIHLAIGRLGEFDFPAGEYLYMGSANGPGGIKARLMHHIRPVLRPHWHLDFLRGCTVLTGGWYAAAPGRLECAWSQVLLLIPGISIPVPGFGSSDCRSGCQAHLFSLPKGIENAALERCLHSVSGNPIVAGFVLPVPGSF